MGKKKNTCKPSSLRKRLEHQLKGIEKHLEMNPRCQMSQTRATTIRAELAGTK